MSINPVDFHCEIVNGRRRRVADDPDWLTTEQAPALLCISVTTLQTRIEIRQAVRRRHRALKPRPGSGFTNAGALWCREDLLALKQIRDVVRVSVTVAARFFMAQREGRI